MPSAQIIPFPVPPPRPILQPSLYGRGIRNFVFVGVADDWHAPGVLAYRGETRAAVDAAWLVEKVLGAPRVKPTMWPGVPGVGERARAYTPPGELRLRDYQRIGAAFLAERDYALLCDQMGIGKSPQAIAAAEARLSMGAVPNTTTPVVLILCPALAKRHWQREINRWTGHDAAILDTLKPEPLPETRYIIANYDILYGARRRDAAGVVHARADLPGWGGTLAGKFLIVIADEAHILRGKSSQRTNAVRELCRGVPVVWGLTGTPMPNYVRDLWALLDILSSGLHGKYYAWARKYCDGRSGQYGWEDKGRSNLDELSARLSFFMLGRSKDAVGLELPPMQREVYRIDVETSAPTVHEGRQAMEKTRAVAAAFRVTATAKRSAVVGNAVEALQNNQKVVVFLYMRAQCDAVAKDIKAKVDCQVFCVHGDLSPEGRDAQALAFRQAAAPACFVATIDSVGIAISLVGADLVIFGDLVPEPWKLLQAEKRCHRFDSKNSVLIRYMVATGTIDEGLAETVIEKLSVLEEAIGENEQEMITALGGKTTEEIVSTLFEKLKSWGKKGEDDA